MDPLSLVQNIIAVASFIYRLPGEVKANKAQCKRIAGRVQAIIGPIKDLNNAEISKTSVKTALIGLQDCLNEIKGRVYSLISEKISIYHFLIFF